MRVAALADIHGNLPALEAVLRDVDAAGVDAVILVGDMTVGPLQGETLDLLTSLGERALWVRGNCERNLVEVFDGTYREAGAAHEAGVIWSGRRLSRAQRDRLATLPLTVSVDVDGLGSVLFCHATARDDEEIVLVDSPVGWFGGAFAGVEEQTVVCGHTHMPFDRLASGRRIVNPGSVGMPYGPPGTVAYWALLGPEVTLRRTAYDLEDAAARMRRSAWPGTAEFVEENVLHGPPSDAEALAIFTSWAQERRARSV
ncbi:MAG TPA: metallophosphoesterase family protein [Actinomycetes bacterium]